MINNNIQTQNTNGFKEHPVQSIMSRTGSFPLKVAYNILKKWGQKSTVVFDPFCGKGTTLLAARMLGLPAYGMDVAPEAIVCTSAKLVDVSLESTLNFVDNLVFNNNCDEEIPAEVRSFFHELTLSQIISIKNILVNNENMKPDSNSDESIFTLATMLGILHGHASYSLSVPSAHAYSMSPNYVTKYARLHGLVKPVRDLKTCLRQKITRCLQVPLPKPISCRVKRGSVFQCTEHFPELVGKVDIILTSPPYFNAQTYAKDNWLRHWFLGYDYKKIQNEYIATNSIDKYSKSMLAAFGQLVSILKPGGLMICIAGDVILKKHNNGVIINDIYKTGTILANMCESPEIGLKVTDFESHSVSSQSRYFHALSKSNGHSKKDLIERVFVAQKSR